LELAQGYVKLDPDQPGVIEEKHLLQGFFEDGGGLTAKKLAEFGVQMPLPDSSAILSMPLFTKPKETNQVDGRHKHNIRSLMDALAPSGRQVINKAFAEVRSLGHSVLTTPHLFIAVLQVDREGMRKAVREAGFEPTELERNLQSIIKPGGTQGPKEEIVVTSRFYRILEMAAEMAPHIEARHIGMAILQEGAEDINSITIQVLQQCRLNPARLLALLQPVSTAQDTGGATRTATPILDSIGKDLTRLAQNGKLGTLVGRSEEIDVLSEILLRKSKGCPVLIGEAGVGKTAIVEGFARRIHEGRMPPSLSRMRVVELATNDLVAGTKYRGDFEERMQGLIAEVIRAGDIILFLDEIHTLIGAREGGSANAGDILKPALARGDIKCIGATTIEEYRRWIESDAALERRFTPVMIGEPTPEETIRILDGIRPSYEAHHGVVIPAASIEAAIKLSCEGMPQRRLPDKAIDLLDQACARVRRLQRPEDNVGGGQPEVTVQFIREVLSVLSGVPTPVCLSVESGIHSERLADLESVLADRIIGQPEAIVALVQAVSLSEAGMRETNRPRGVFLFTGPAGVGKSSLAKAFAEENGRHLIQIDMAEYTEKHQMAKLIGAPAGYIGHGREGYLTGKLKSHPHCVLLLDEMDKAHPDVSRLFIHLFEEGRITDAMGRTVDARQALIIMTANIGAESALSGSGHGIGFLPSSQRTSSSQIEGLLRQSFSREFIDRIDQVIAFRHLNRQDIVNIARRLLDAVWVRFAEQHNIQIKEDEGLLDFICEKGFTKESGVRPLKRIIEEYVVAQLSRMLIEGTAAGKEQLVATVSEGEIVFNAG
jgi:ATP-dependent Clp protease ATP-binding subunit ClpA